MGSASIRRRPRRPQSRAGSGCSASASASRSSGAACGSRARPEKARGSPSNCRRARAKRSRRAPSLAKLRILLVDDHTIVRHGLRKILQERQDWEVVAEAGDGREAVRQILQLEPDVAIVDIGMPLLNGIEVTRQVARRSTNVRVLILSMHAEEAYITQALQAGATGYLLKDSADTDLIRAVTDVAGGRSFFSPAVAKVMLDDYVRHLADKGIVDRYETLSEREREIFQDRKSTRLNSSHLGISYAVFCLKKK